MVFFQIAPTNISVLSYENIERKINHLQGLISMHPDMEIVCTDSCECFDGNREYLRRRALEESNRQVRSILEKDREMLSQMQSEMSNARQFYLVMRFKNMKPNRGERPMYFVRNSNPAIITQEMFDQAAQLRSSRRNEIRNMGARPFAKKLSCGCCGSLFRSKRIDNTWYWVCRKHEESNTLCEMPSVPENEIKAAFQRLYYNLKHNTAVLDFYAKHLILVRNRQMLWSPAAIELNKEISDILDQSHTLSLLNRQGVVDSDIFITKNNQLAEQLRKAKQQKEKLYNLEHDQVIDQTQQLLETLLNNCCH